MIFTFEECNNAYKITCSGDSKSEKTPIAIVPKKENARVITELLNRNELEAEEKATKQSKNAQKVFDKTR